MLFPIGNDTAEGETHYKIHDEVEISATLWEDGVDTVCTSNLYLLF